MSPKKSVHASELGGVMSRTSSEVSLFRQRLVIACKGGV